MGPAAICIAGTDTYRPGALCTDSAKYHPLVVWSRLRFSRQCCAMLPEAVHSSPGRYVPAPALHIAAGPICSASDMYRQFDRYEAGAVELYVAPQPVICSALGAISAVPCPNAVLAAEASSKRGTARTGSTSRCAASRSTAAPAATPRGGRRRRFAATGTGEAAGRRCRSMSKRFAAPAPLLARRR